MRRADNFLTNRATFESPLGFFKDKVAQKWQHFGLLLTKAFLHLLPK
jgi:hypothetical protein